LFYSSLRDAWTPKNHDVSPLRQAVDEMNRIGLNTSLPPSVVTQTPDGKAAPGTWQFVHIDEEGKKGLAWGLPGGPGVGFPEYANNPGKVDAGSFERARTRTAKALSETRLPDGEIHPNTARKLLSIWIAVPDIAQARRQSELFGFESRGVREPDGVGEKGYEFQCGQGTLIFFQPTNDASPLTVLVKKSGYGPVGISVAVADISKTQQIAEAGTARKLPIRQLDGKSGFVVPAESASGAFVEFIQQ
jgi:hypothetical protein